MNRKRFSISTKKTVPMLVITIIFAMTGAFLMLSRTLLGAPQGDLQHTPIGEAVPIQGNGEVVIQDWTYNPHEQHMIATLHIDRSTADRSTEPTFSAQDRSNPRDELPVTILHEDQDYYMVHIDAVPPSFDVIGMDIQEATIDDPVMDGKDASNDEPANLARIYADHREVPVDDSLSVEDSETYDQNVLNMEHERLDDEQDERQQAIENIEERIVNLEQELIDVEADILYSTEDEQVELESEESQIEAEIDSLETDLELEKEEIEVAQDEQKMIEEQMDMESSG